MAGVCVHPGAANLLVDLDHDGRVDLLAGRLPAAAQHTAQPA